MTNKNEATAKEVKKPGYNAPVERNPHKDMLASITMVDGVEVAKWFHRGRHVFTVFNKEDGSMTYKTAIDE